MRGRFFSLYTKTRFPRMITGDTPSLDKLHLGHLVGTLNSRLKFQNTHECYIIIADTHAHASRPRKDVKSNAISIVMDYLSVGIDPNKCIIFPESSVPAIFQLAANLAMFVPKNQVERNPTLKEEIKRNRHINTGASMGFFMYPILQAADILAFKGEIVPVGKDQLPHIELTRDIANRINHFVGHNIFPHVRGITSDQPSLPGIGKPLEQGVIPKMSKSFNNAIFLSDSPEEVREKINKLYTGPNRTSSVVRPSMMQNPLWIFMQTFLEKNNLEQINSDYLNGKLSDRECKKLVAQAIIRILEPIREKRFELEARGTAYSLEILTEGGKKAQAVAHETLLELNEAMSLFPPEIIMPNEQVANKTLLTS